MSSEKIEFYLSLLRDPEKEVRAEAMKGLVAFGATAVPPLLDLLKNNDWVIRYRAAEALGYIRDTDTIDSLILLTTDDKDHVRYMATKSLGRMQDPRIPPVLIRMLSDDHSYTRRIAAGGLVASGSADALGSLRHALENESDPDVKNSIQDAIQQIRK